MKSCTNKEKNLEDALTDLYIYIKVQEKVK